MAFCTSCHHHLQSLTKLCNNTCHVSEQKWYSFTEQFFFCLQMRHFTKQLGCIWLRRLSNLTIEIWNWLKDKTELKTYFHSKHLPFFGCDTASSLKIADIWCAVVCGAITGEDWDCGVPECNIESVKRYRCGIVLPGFQLNAQIL